MNFSQKAFIHILWVVVAVCSVCGLLFCLSVCAFPSVRVLVPSSDLFLLLRMVCVLGEVLFLSFLWIPEMVLLIFFLFTAVFCFLATAFFCPVPGPLCLFEHRALSVFNLLDFQLAPLVR